MSHADSDRKTILESNHGRPHVVVLGAGASLAAFPRGDRLGRKLPLMWNIVDVVGLGALLDKTGIGDNLDNFEKLYSDLITRGRNPELVTRIDRMIFDYFAAMELPAKPTLYDHLVQSLRNEDVIVTFNWDPFLMQALVRNWQVKMLPNLCFLHGNTAIGYCLDHKPIHVGQAGRQCSQCGQPFQESRLLYPIGEKNYQKDPFIAKNWEVLQDALRDAYLVTVFGYSAPATDAEAIALFTSAWGDPHQRPLEEIEIIDVKSEAELRSTWSPFIHSHHYRATNDFYRSIIALNPRRSCEAMWSSMIDIAPVNSNPIPRDADWPDVRRFFGPLFDEEGAAARR
jgi:hypothetical protein